MSASPEETEDVARVEGKEEELVGEEMMDVANHESENHPAISEMLEEERQQQSEQPAGQDDTGVVNKYRQLLLDEQDAGSDSGSVDALPRRVGSPVDSTASIPDDSPSVQVSMLNCSSVMRSKHNS